MPEIPHDERSFENESTYAAGEQDIEQVDRGQFTKLQTAVIKQGLYLRVHLAFHGVKDTAFAPE